MATFIATWNPTKFPSLLDDWEVDGERIRNDGYVSDRWSMGGRTSGAAVGDRVYLLRQHGERGIVRAGTIASQVFQAEHWDSERASAGDLCNYVYLRWTEQVETEQRLPTETLLAEVPNVS